MAYQNFIQKKIPQKAVLSMFVTLSVWWIILFFIFKSRLEEQNLFWAASYQILALVGAIYGFLISKFWGGFKSLLGKAIIYFSLGLLAQVFGQSVFSFFNLVLKIEIPYPSVADIGFFSSMIFYIYALFLTARISGTKLGFKSYKNRSLAFILPLILIIASYFFFLKEYTFDWSDPLRIFLDFAYPLGDAFYLSLALLILMLSRNVLGGIMKWPIFYILIALIVQYSADFNFLYQAMNGTWVNGGYGDALYMLAYFFTAIALIHLGLAFEKIKSS